MPRILPLSDSSATPTQNAVLQQVQKSLGCVPNLIATMAQSPAVAEAYLAFAGALAKGVLGLRTRERLALTVAEANACDYCLAAHAAFGARAGLDAEAITHARAASVPGDEREEAALDFARHLLQQRGQVSDHQVAKLRQLGWNDAEITEIIAHTALNIFTNYFNLAAQTEVDFPAQPKLASSSTQTAPYTVFETGSLAGWLAKEVVIPGLGRVPGKLFLKDKLGLTASEISINALPPGGCMPFHHRHIENEEIYFFIHGQGQMQVNGQTFEVKEGSVIRLAPEAQRVWRNTSNETLLFLIMQSRQHSLRQWGTQDSQVSDLPVVWSE